MLIICVLPGNEQIIGISSTHTRIDLRRRCEAPMANTIRGQRRRKEVWDGGGGQNHRRTGDGSPPAWFRGGAPLGVRGDEIPRKLNNFRSSYKQIRIFGSISHCFLHIPICFFRACRHHSTKSAKWGGGI